MLFAKHEELRAVTAVIQLLLLSVHRGRQGSGYNRYRYLERI